MGISANQYGSIMDQYDRTRMKNQRILDQRTEALHKEIPELEELQGQIIQLSFQQARNELLQPEQAQSPAARYARHMQALFEKKQALLEAGEEYTYFPTDYVVSFSVGSEYSQDFARTVLDSIIKNYFATYGEKYINQQTLPNNNVRGTDGQYDYIERVEILDAWALNISDYLAAKKETQPNYRSAETGYSFSDLYEIYKSYID